MLRSCLGVDGDPRSVAMRREALLCNEKSDFVTISVVTSLDPPVGSADSSRRLYLLFPLALPILLDGFTVTSRGTIPPHFSNALCPSVGFTDSSRRLCLHFSQVIPALPAGSASTSRQFHRHFSNVYSLLAGSSLQQSYFALNYYFK